MNTREIDQLVAENVMGWTRDETAARCEAWCWRDKDGLGHQYIHKWHPSTDTVSSKQLRDKMRADGWGYIIRVEDDINCAFWRPYGINVGVDADTEEMAVALAALRAVGQALPDGGAPQAEKELAGKRLEAGEPQEGENVG